MKLFGPSGFKESMQKNVTLEIFAEGTATFSLAP